MNTPVTCDVGNINSVPRCTLYDAESTRLAGVADPAVAERIVNCINACANIPDPAAAIPAAVQAMDSAAGFLREAAKQLRGSGSPAWADAADQQSDNLRATINLLKP